MKHKIRYEPPVGNTIDDASIERVVEDVKIQDESFWAAGECFGVLELEGASTEPRLTIVYKEGYGFYLEMALPNGVDRDYFHPMMDKKLDDVVKVWVGQNYLRIPRAFFVNREKAAMIVDTFCRQGQRDPSVPWVNSDDTGWEFFDPDDQSAG